MSLHDIWQQCLFTLQNELPSQQFATWIRPLQCQVETDSTINSAAHDSLNLLAPNRFIKDWVDDKYLARINELVVEVSEGSVQHITLAITENKKQPMFTVAEEQVSNLVRGVVHVAHAGNLPSAEHSAINSRNNANGLETHSADKPPSNALVNEATKPVLKAIDSPSSFSQKSSAISSHQSNVIPNYNFKTFVEGKSNQLARAASIQVAENPGGSYNPLFLYGGVGLGKTHLMHAVGNALLERKPDAKVVYLHSERFVADMVKALQLNAIDDFKRYYRSVDALLIDDIQFFANKERSQEEFFHTFNTLLQEGKQIILTCDKYPKEIKGLEERLKSRFGWGLTVAVEPPELETRVAILMKKAEQANMELPKDAAFFIAQRLRSNVRELEGALKRVIAQAHFKARPIDIDLIKESLKDLLSLQDRLVSIDNIQKTVAEYYKIKVSDLLSKRRNRSVARPRQVAMALAKELTSHSLPEIGDAFGGRDHTTVLHACRKIEELKESNSDIHEDVKNLLRILTT